jgi:hypothetical protein
VRFSGLKINPLFRVTISIFDLSGAHVNSLF